MSQNESGAGRSPADETEAEPVNYKIDAARSRFIVKAFSAGMLSAFAHNPTIAIRNFTGQVRFSPAAPDSAALELRIKAGSLETTDEVSDKDRREIERQMREDVLETGQYPEIVFVSQKIAVEQMGEGQFSARLNGQLTLRGITRTCDISARIYITGTLLRAQGEFPLRQSDFNIKPVSALGGTIKLKDELRFSFEIVARQQ